MIGAMNRCTTVLATLVPTACGAVVTPADEGDTGSTTSWSTSAAGDPTSVGSQVDGDPPPPTGDDSLDDAPPGDSSSGGLPIGGYGVLVAIGELDGAGAMDMIAGYSLEPPLERLRPSCDGTLDREWLDVTLGTELVVDGPFAGQDITVFLTGER